MLRFVKGLLMGHTTLFINSASQRCKWSGEGLTQILPPLPPTAVCQIVPRVNTLSSLPRTASSRKPALCQPSGQISLLSEGKFIWVWTVATTFKMIVMARKDLESMCWAGLLFSPTIKLEGDLNQHPLTWLFPCSSQGQLDVIRVVSEWPEVNALNE